MSQNTWKRHGVKGICQGCYKTKLVADQRVQLDDGSWRTLYDIQQEGKAASMSRYATSYIDDSLLTDKSMDEADVREMFQHTIESFHSGRDNINFEEFKLLVKASCRIEDKLGGSIHSINSLNSLNYSQES